MDNWDEYDRWNDALLEVLFPKLEVPEPVYMDFEDDVLEDLATRMSIEPDQVEERLAHVVAATLPDLGPAAIFERHMIRVRTWVRSGRITDPPFVALLASFCLAAEQMSAGDGMAASNYFGRLRVVLQRDPGDQRIETAYRNVAERLWGELNRWLLVLDGQRGTPTAFALTHRYVGLTLSQALVRSADRERLKEFFRQYGFAPGADVPPGELQMVLDSWMSQRPCPASSSLELLWKRKDARPRISQAAAVALAAWDGSVRERGGPAGGGSSQRGHLALTLEMGGFPRKRFALQALLYLPQPSQARDATILTASPATTIELVPDLPGALGLGRGSSLHAGDVLEGVLKIQDSLTDQTLERRPRRLVLFREDELSRRWVESPQVMLGDNVRLLAHEALVPRLTDVLAAVARPGWAVADAYPGQPDGWVVFTGLEVFNHPGDLVHTERMDDLSPLVPLTGSQLKVAGGFSLPGQVRGKWHAWLPPEVRAISDATGGLRVRVVDQHRFAEGLGDSEETVLAEWEDQGTGVIVRSLAELSLEDGDYRLDMKVGDKDDVVSSTMVLLRSSDTPDARQWSLLDPVSYGPGVGALGLAGGTESTKVTGFLVHGASRLRAGKVAVPPAPGWATGVSSSKREVSSIVRLTMPDSESCLYTGRHVQDIETVELDRQGRPTKAWSLGRCRGCGLERRYPTRLPRARHQDQSRTEPVPTTSGRRHDLSALAVVTAEQGADWAVALDAVLHTGGGTWGQLERIALQVVPTALFVDQFARTLEVVGHIDVRRHPETMQPTSWEVAPTSLCGTTDGLLFAGFWPGSLFATVGEAIEGAGGSLAVEENSEGPHSYFAVIEADAVAEIESVREHDVPVVASGWEQVASVLPPLSEVLASLPRQSDSLVGDITWYQPKDNTWAKVADLSSPGAYRVRRFSTLDVVRTDEDVRRGVVARSTVQLSKHLAALMDRRPLLAYDPTERVLVVPLGADLPGLYGRAVVAASGCPPTAVRQRRLLRYASVPAELASHIYDLMSH